MKDIVIKQNGKACELWEGDSLVASGGRVEIKRRAKALHLETGAPVWNWKKSGTKCQVYYGKAGIIESLQFDAGSKLEQSKCYKVWVNGAVMVSGKDGGK